jgi:transforming growth factor-beta-induced protein
MKQQRNFILKVFMLIFMVLSLASCDLVDNDDDDDASKNIVETAIDDGRFDTLVAALQAAGLDDDLEGTGPFTVFAPTDDAFAALPEGTVDTLLEPANQDILIDILTYHVYAGEVFAADVIDLAGTAVEMLNGSDLRIDVIDGSVILSLNGNRQATVTITDIEASNGVIHVIDMVLDPNDATSSIVQTAIDNGNFTTLVTALQTAGLDDALEGAGPFTVFAPTDTAFAKLPAGAVADLLKPENIDALTNLLQYHVYAGSVLAADAIALAGNNVVMLNEDSMSIDVVGNMVVLNPGGGREAMVTITDVLCSNGVIHVIDTVLDPTDAM